MLAAITAALQAVPKIVDGITAIVTSIATLIDNLKTANTMKKIELEQREMAIHGDTSKLEERFRTGKW